MKEFDWENNLNASTDGLPQNRFLNSKKTDTMRSYI